MRGENILMVILLDAEKLMRFDWATLYIPKVNEIHKGMLSSYNRAGN